MATDAVKLALLKTGTHALELRLNVSQLVAMASEQEVKTVMTGLTMA